MRMSCSLIIASALLMPLQAVAQSGSVAGSGSGSAGVTTGTATGAPNVRMPGPPGTNSLGAAQSSGSLTTGSASGSSSDDAKLRADDPRIDKKIKSICRGC